MSREKGRLTTADYLPIEEFNRLVDSLHSDGLYMWDLYCRLSFCTALRASDVLSLRWEHILDKESLDKCEKKTGKARRITFNESVQQKIKELYTLQGEPDKEGSPFFNPATGRTYSLETVHIYSSLSH